MNLDARSGPTRPPAPDSAAILAAVEAAADAVGDAGATAPAATALTGWELGAALTGTLDRWTQVTSGYRRDLGELARMLRDADDGPHRCPEPGTD